MLTLDGRLSVCASLVRKGAHLADVGTDHAYLPVWLAKNGLITSAVACDVREKPLRSGQENIEYYKVGDIVTTRLSDGLDEVKPEEADDVVIAGMGGELIADIISRAPWLKSAEKRLILQPMTKPELLRRFLCENGYSIESETPCAHGGKFYTVLLVSYTGEAFTPTPSFRYAGKLQNDGECARGCMNSVLSKLLKKRNGTALGGGDTSEFDEAINYITQTFGVDGRENEGEKQ